MREALCEKGIALQTMKRLMGNSSADVKTRDSVLTLPRIQAAKGIRTFSADSNASFVKLRAGRNKGVLEWRREHGRVGPMFMHPLIDLPCVTEVIQDISDEVEQNNMLDSMSVYLMASVKIYG